MGQMGLLAGRVPFFLVRRAAQPFCPPCCACTPLVQQVRRESKHSVRALQTASTQHGKRPTALHDSQLLISSADTLPESRCCCAEAGQMASRQHERAALLRDAEAGSLGNGQGTTGKKTETLG